MYNSKKMNGALRELWNFSLKQEYPLHSAATTGNIELLNHLLEQGYELTDIDNYGDTPLHCASSEGQIGIIQYITSHKKCSIVLNQINFKGITPLAVACAEGQFDCAVKLLKTPNCKVNHKYEKSSALHLAVASDNVDCVELLVNCGSKVNKRNEFGETALHVALRGLRNSCAPDALTLETIECIKLILNTGINLVIVLSCCISFEFDCLEYENNSNVEMKAHKQFHTRISNNLLTNFFLIYRAK